MEHDPVEHPSHYTRLTPQPLEVIEAWGLDFHAAQVLKYLARAGYKGSALEDLKKARFYLDRLIVKTAKADKQRAQVIAEIERETEAYYDQQETFGTTEPPVTAHLTAHVPTVFTQEQRIFNDGPYQDQLPTKPIDVLGASSWPPAVPYGMLPEMDTRVYYNPRKPYLAWYYHANTRTHMQYVDGKWAVIGQESFSPSGEKDCDTP